MSKDKIEVNMNIYDIPIVVEQLEKENKEIERLNNIINKKEQLLGDNIKRLEREVAKRDNIINKIEEHFVFLKMNSTGGNKEFFEDILDFMKALRELKGSDKK